MIYSNIRMILPAGQKKGAIKILSRYAQRTRFLTGCRSCRLYDDLLDSKSIMLEEIWDDERMLTDHLGSPSYREILLVMEMASTPPEVNFIRFSESSGFETIEQARGDQKSSL